MVYLNTLSHIEQSFTGSISHGKYGLLQAHFLFLLTCNFQIRQSITGAKLKNA